MINIAKYFNKTTASLFVGLFIVAAVLVVPLSVHAQQQNGPPTCQADQPLDPKNPCIPAQGVPKTEPVTGLCTQGQACTANKLLGNNPLIQKYVNPLIVTLTAVIGVVIVIALVVSGIQYSSAAGDSSQIAAAKKRIINVIIALIAYVFMGGFINWLIPGGII
ncbi:MAG TPA: hypothetical protein VF733_02945 [Candidatus Saccharimonadales bacterium]